MSLSLLLSLVAGLGVLLVLFVRSACGFFYIYDMYGVCVCVFVYFSFRFFYFVVFYLVLFCFVVRFVCFVFARFVCAFLCGLCDCVVCFSFVHIVLFV